ncbi:chondroitin AC/alginate lyase [Parasitella parasitica]|nr:chondroitin AC/alginate lyase [Parasitella parasitica]
MKLKKIISTLALIPVVTYASPEELKTLYDRKVDFIIQDYSTYIKQIPKWLETFSSDQGTWSDVDYTVGCTARRANWPAQQHFIRIAAMASQYRADPKNSKTLLAPISKAMDYWFDNNYKPDACLDQGGVEGGECPCDTPGFWNTNWFGQCLQNRRTDGYNQMILMPRFISNTCLLLKDKLTESQLENCTLVTQRVYDRINTEIVGVGRMTGANMLDSATAVLNLGLLKDNATIVKEALHYYYNQTLITPETGVDGIKADGSYLQHFAQLYNGNYGKDFINNVAVVYIQTSNTSFSPPQNSQDAFLTLLNGTEWMVVNNKTMNPFNNTLLWEYSAIGRMVSFAAADKQASGGVNLNLTRIGQAAEGWENARKIQKIVKRMENISGQGKFRGTRSFYTSDYLVHRSRDYVTTLKSFSNRTSNSECNNDQNPFGFHLSDGSIFSYIDGDEYSDVFGAYDWNLIPGTTVDYDATPFGCNITQFSGNTTFVGSVTRNKKGYSHKGGMSVMQYLNPMTGSLQWEKTFFFFPGFYAVQIGPIHHNGKAKILTTLDQSNLKGPVYLNNKMLSDDQPSMLSSIKTKHLNLWHNRILYTVVNQNKTTPKLKITKKPTSVNGWASIGISTGNATQSIFTATLEHAPETLLDDKNDKVKTPPVTYIAQLNTHEKRNQHPDRLVQFAHQDDAELGVVRGAYDVKEKTIALAFWTAGSYQTPWGLTVKTDSPILTFFTLDDDEDEYSVTVSDPTQLLTKVKLTITQDGEESKDYSVDLPQGPLAGSSVNVN